MLDWTDAKVCLDIARSVMTRVSSSVASDEGFRAWEKILEEEKSGASSLSSQLAGMLAPPLVVIGMMSGALPVWGGDVRFYFNTSMLAPKLM